MTAAIAPARGSSVIARGDLLIFVSYVPDGEGYRENDSKQPALILARRGGRSAWAIPLSDAWRYCNADGFPTTYAYKRVADIGNHLGLGDTLQVRRRIWQAIGDYLPDLLAAKDFAMVQGERHKAGPVIGEAIVTANEVIVAEREILH